MLQKCPMDVKKRGLMSVTKVPDVLQKCPICHKSALGKCYKTALYYKSALLMLQKCLKMLQKCPIPLALCPYSLSPPLDCRLRICYLLSLCYFQALNSKKVSIKNVQSKVYQSFSDFLNVPNKALKFIAYYFQSNLASVENTQM